jgi:hypothetical protein
MTRTHFQRASCAFAVAAAAWLVSPAWAIDGGNTVSVPIRSSPARPGNTERIEFTGNAKLTSALDRDTANKRPTVELVVDLTGITGKCADTGTSYTIAAQDIVTLPHKNNLQIDVVFPMVPSVDAPLSAVRTGLASFAVNVDIATGNITGANGTLSTRNK